MKTINLQPSLGILLQCFLRTYLVGASFNTRGLQNVGMAYAMDPGLKKFYSDPKQLRQARKRYLKIYNTHPFWSPLFVGCFLFLESRIAKGLFSAGSFNNVKQTVTYTLSAIGDSFFGGSLLVFWSLSTCCLLVYELKVLAWSWLIFLFLALQVFKICTFWWGFRQGLGFLQRLQKWRLIDWGGRIKVANAILVLILWYAIYPFSFHPALFSLWTALVGLIAWAVTSNFLPRSVLALVLAGGLWGWTWLSALW